MAPETVQQTPAPTVHMWSSSGRVMLAIADARIVEYPDGSGNLVPVITMSPLSAMQLAEAVLHHAGDANRQMEEAMEPEGEGEDDELSNR